MLHWNYRESNNGSLDLEDANCEREAILHAVLEHSSDGIFIVEPVWDKFRFVSTNQIYLQMQSIGRADIAGQWLDECLPETTAHTAGHHLTICLHQKQPRSYQEVIETDTQSQFLLITLFPIGVADKVSKIVGVCRDLTEQQQSRAAINLLQTIALSVAESQDFDAAIAVALQKICQITGWDYGEAWMPNAESGIVECSPAWYSLSNPLEAFHKLREQQTFPLNSNFGQIWSIQPVKWLPGNLAEPVDSIIDPATAIKTGFQAGLSVPILASGQILAVLVFFMFEPRLEYKLISLISTVTVQLGGVIHHRKYRNIFENAVAGIYQASPDGRYQTVNPMLARILGYDSPRSLLVSVTNLYQLYLNPGRREEFHRLLQAQNTVSGFEAQVYQKNGSVIWIAESGRVIRDDRGELIGYEGTVEDITQRKLAEAELHKRDSLLQAVATAMHHLLTDTDYKAAIINALATLGAVTSAERVYIYETHPHPQSEEPALSLRFEWLRASVQSNIDRPDRQNLTPSSFGLTHWSSLLETSNALTDFINSLPKEEREMLEREGLLSRLVVPIRVDHQLWGYLGFDEGTTSLKHWSEGEISMLMAIGDSIGGALHRQRTEELIRYQALHDRLTGLPNRTLLNDKLNQALEAAASEESQFALMFLDLDHFKTINDTLGHAIGDLLLQAVVKRLVACLRDGDTIARWGGDEFILLLPYVYRAKDAATVAQRILEVLHPAFELDGHQLLITSSIGIALYPRDGEDGETLIRKADAALYRAKEEGRNSFQF